MAETDEYAILPGTASAPFWAIEGFAVRHDALGDVDLLTQHAFTIPWEIHDRR